MCRTWSLPLCLPGKPWRSCCLQPPPLSGITDTPLAFLLAPEDQTQTFTLVRRAFYKGVISPAKVLFLFVFCVCTQRWCLLGKTLTHVERQGSGLRHRDLAGFLMPLQSRVISFGHCWHCPGAWTANHRPTPNILSCIFLVLWHLNAKNSLTTKGEIR